MAIERFDGIRLLSAGHPAYLLNKACLVNIRSSSQFKVALCLDTVIFCSKHPEYTGSVIRHVYVHCFLPTYSQMSEHKSVLRKQMSSLSIPVSVGTLFILQLMLMPQVVLSQTRAAEFYSTEFGCTVYPSVVAELGSSVAGVLESVDVERSQFVKRGDIVATFESKAERTALELLKAKAKTTLDTESGEAGVADAPVNPERSELPIVHGMLSGQGFDVPRPEAEGSRETAVQGRENRRVYALELAHAQALLDRRTIRSPIDGIVVQQHREAGEFVDGQGIVTVAQLHPLHIEAFVDVQDIDFLAEGMTAEIWVERGTDVIRAATVDSIDKLVDTASGNVGVRLVMANDDYRILAGSRCQVRFTAASGMPEAVRPADSQVQMADKRDSDGSYSDGFDSDGFDDVLTGLEMDSHQPARYTADQKATLTEQTDESAEQAVPDLCIWPRKFDNISDARKEARELAQDGIESTLQHRTALDLKGHYIQSPAFNTLAAAQNYMQHLKEAGLNDIALLAESDTDVRVALGTFENNEGALARLEYVLRQGVRAELLPWVEELDEIYVTPVEWSFLRSANCP